MGSFMVWWLLGAKPGAGRALAGEVKQNNGFSALGGGERTPGTAVGLLVVPGESPTTATSAKSGGSTGVWGAPSAMSGCKKSRTCEHTRGHR